MMGLDLSEPVPEKIIPKADTYMMDVFAYIESICVSKKSLVLTEQDERRYGVCRFMVQKGLSFYPDLILYVDEVNLHPGMSPRMEYDFLMATIPSKTRKSMKWTRKAAPSLYMDAVRKHYGYNERKAEEAMKILTIEQLAMIDNKNNKEDSWTFSGDLESRSD